MHHVNGLGISTEIIFLHNSIYSSTNNIISVSAAFSELAIMDTVLIESDLIFDENLIRDLLAERHSQVVLAKYEKHMDGTLVELDNEKIIFSSSQNPKSKQGLFKTVNIYYFTDNFIKNIFKPLLDIYVGQGLTDSYYETPLKLVAQINLTAIKPLITDRAWFEIDDLNDFDIASNLFSKNRVADIHTRYGGFWRFEDKIDFTYLSNPYFPNEEFYSDIEQNLRSLIHHYPSSQEVNAKLMSAVLNIDENLIVVGNGASEIINIVSSKYKSQTILSPTFKEYENRCFDIRKINTLDELSNENHGCVIIVNPNNPSGEIYNKTDLLDKIASMTSTLFIIDESFMDFVTKSQSLLYDDILQDFDNLLIIKSIGKSHGVGGLRLGALVGQRAKDFRKNASIWNINSVAEYFLQRFKKYEKSYINSLELIKSQRSSMEDKLANLLGVSIKKSEGNFVYLEIDKKFAENLQGYLFKKGFIIKLIDIDVRTSAIRIAIRNGFDNHKLCTAVEKFQNND